MLRSSGGLSSLVLISVFCSIVAAREDGSRSTVDLRHLAGTVKLLQLQLRQASETAELLSAVLSGPDLQSASDNSLVEQPEVSSGIHTDNTQSLQQAPAVPLGKTA